MDVSKICRKSKPDRMVMEAITYSCCHLCGSNGNGMEMFFFPEGEEKSDSCSRVLAS